jgi:hypothetical protein
VVDVAAFARDGFLKVEQPEARPLADAARAVLWQQIGLSPDDPDAWSEPVKWAADLTGAGPFGRLVNSRKLADTLDALCGAVGWVPRGALGNIPVRFPVRPPHDDRGWHIDLNTPTPDGSWRLSGRPHTLLVLTLLSEVGRDDAPTRIRVGSHRDVAAVLTEEAVAFEDSGPLIDEASAGRPVAYATGRPGDRYVVHPFTAHAADEHRGRTPRFMAQSPVMLSRPLTPQSDSVLACAWH